MKNNFNGKSYTNTDNISEDLFLRLSELLASEKYNEIE